MATSDNTIIEPVDLLLIHPGAGHSAYGDLSEDLVAVEPPLWARLIAGYIQDRGYSVRIIDAEADRKPPTEIALDAFAMRPRLVCIVAYGHQPSASTQQMEAVYDTAKAVRSVCSAPIGVVGGHVSALPERTLRECRAIDYAIIGEGPVTIASILEKGRFSSSAPGLAWLHSGNGSFIKNESAPLIEDLSQLHGNVWDKLPMRKYRAHNWQCLDDLSGRQPYASIYTSLGCPYSCLTGDTPVNTLYGNFPIKTLAEIFGDKGIPVYTYDPLKGSALIADGIRIRKYGTKSVVRVAFDDGTHIDCTPDHEFFQFGWGNGRDGNESWEKPCRADALPIGAHIRAIRFDLNDELKRVYVSWKRRGRQSRSSMVMEYLLERKLVRSEHIHHIDRDSTNDHPSNLECFGSALEHF